MPAKTLSLLLLSFILSAPAWAAQPQVKSKPKAKAKISAQDVQNGEEMAATPENLAALKQYDYLWEQSMENFMKGSSPLESSAAGTKGIVIEISKSQQHMIVYMDGVKKLDTMVSTGMNVKGDVTPSGTWKAGGAEAAHFSQEFHAVLPWAIRLGSTGYFIHAATEGAMVYMKKGIPHSHGCIRTPPENAKALFEMVKKAGVAHTQIIINS